MKIVTKQEINVLIDVTNCRCGNNECMEKENMLSPGDYQSGHNSESAFGSSSGVSFCFIHRSGI